MERAILVISQFDTDRDWAWESEDLAAELRELTRASGGVVVGEVFCRRDRPTPNLFVGRGKAESISVMSAQRDTQVIIFGRDLTATQQRNLEEVIDVKVVDRTQLILDIFSRRAKSGEGKIQVELAQLVYLLPRLAGRGILLSRLGGGIGTRGPGEQKLEVEKRRIRERIAGLKSDIEDLKAHRQALRRTRQKRFIPTIAIIGYTNAGKSTLLNAMTNSNVVVMDKVFTTLDPTARKFVLPNNQKVLFIDTVGFLHKLPLHLIEAFKATLEEVIGADILLHILDVNHPKAAQQMDAVYEVLNELKIQDRPIVTALNKIDKIQNQVVIDRFLKSIQNSVAISALKGKGLGQLIDRITFELSDLMVPIKAAIPDEQMRLVNLIYDEGRITSREYRDGSVYIEARVPIRIRGLLEARGVIKDLAR